MLVFIGAMVACLCADVSMSAALLAGFLCFWVVGLRRGYGARALAKMAAKGGKDAFSVVRVLALIGLITASWRASGTIAFFIAKGVSLITPSLFILIAFALSAVLSYALGTCFGVVGMATRNATDSFTSLLKWENMEKGVEIQYSDNTLKIGLHIIMTYGVNIPAISDSIKSKVVYSVEEFTGVKVGEVKIFVDSLKM